MEVAVDEWALATVADLGDRTRIRGVAGAIPVKAPHRRRRRKTVQPEFSPIGSMVRKTDPSHPGANSGSSVRGRGMHMLAWSLVVSAVLVLTLGVIAIIVLIQSNSDGIPKVTDIQSTLTSDSIEFHWSNPGLLPGDSYQINTTPGNSRSIQQSTTFSVDAKPGDSVCVTVTVNREGKTGEPSKPKCVDVSD